MKNKKFFLSFIFLKLRINKKAGISIKTKIENKNRGRKR